VKRQSLLPRVLSVTEAAAVCRKPFKPPCSNGYDDHNTLARHLWARKRFVPWGSSMPALVAIPNRLNEPSIAEKDVVEESFTLPPGVEPLVLWQPEESQNGAANLVPIVVDPLLVRFITHVIEDGVCVYLGLQIMVDVDVIEFNPMFGWREMGEEDGGRVAGVPNIP
jgi:DNA repair and recombination RAD54-like protein